MRQFCNTVLLLLLITPALLGQHRKPVTKRAAKVALPPAKGNAVYTQYCLTCHQADGAGVPNLNPPLKGSDWVTGDKIRLINVLLKGLQEPIEINGDTYDNVMPAHDFLTDGEIADVLTFIRSNFGNKADAVKPDEVTALRAK